jgi:integrase
MMDKPQKKKKSTSNESGSGKRFSAKTPGIRYRKHPTRKHGVNFDRYYMIYYRINGKRIEEGVGWASENWSESRVAKVLFDLKEAQRTGKGPQTLKEQRELEKQKRDAEEKRKKQAEADSKTFGQVWEIYKEAAELYKKSMKREEQLFELWIKPEIGHWPMRDIVPLHIEKIRKNMKENKRADRTFQYAYAVIRQVFNFAKKNRIYLGSCPEVSKIKIDNQRVRFLTREEADNLLKALGKKSEEVRDMAALSLNTGMRAGEIFNLTWGDVDLEKNILTLKDTKNRETRTVYLNQAARNLFEKRTRGKASDLVFPGRQGKKHVWISGIFQEAVKEEGLNDGVKDRRNKVCFHTLRHTFASWLVMEGVPLYTVKESLGHKTIRMTERYAHLSPDAGRRAVEVLDKTGADTEEKAEVVEMKAGKK